MDLNINKNNEEKEDENTVTFLDNKVLRMMKMMGYKSGLGLGKNQQGIQLPVEIKSQLGKRGLGLNIEHLQSTNEEWDFSLEDVKTKENVEWLENKENLQITFHDMKKWPKEGVPVVKMQDQYNFCDRSILNDVLKGKDIFEELDVKELCQARGRANPFETIRSVFFMNRAALKMANIDAATDFMFTNVDRNCHHKDPTGPYYFADVCAGPGGFTEYILWRKKWMFKGFGLTLRDENDFKITNSLCASPVTFSAFYGVKGDGDVCCPENIIDFKEKVLHETENKGVHFIMSDGGFSVEGNENIQEVLSKNIYICQCLVALEILRAHGHFVTKLFDTFTCFSVGLVYLMYKCFEKVCILKPNSSRPANSERYLVCCNLRNAEDTENVKTYLRSLVNKLWHLRNNSQLDIVEIVPLHLITSDKKFYSYIYNSNNRIAKNQTISLKKLAVFCRNPSITDYRQDQLRKECLLYWQIPDKPKLPLSKFTVEDLLLTTIDKRELLLVHPREFHKSDDFSDFVSDLTEWHYSLMQCKRNNNICNFYAGVGFSKVYRLQCGKWIKVKNLQLPRGTLLYGELVKERFINSCIFNNEMLQHKYSLHVIDALRLGDVSLADLKFEERISLIRTFCKAVNNEFRLNAIRIRPKATNTLSSLSTNFYLRQNELSGNYISPLPVLGYKINEESYEVNSVLLLKTNGTQSFHSTYVLRIQLFIHRQEDEEKYIPLQTLINFVRQKS